MNVIGKSIDNIRDNYATNTSLNALATKMDTNYATNTSLNALATKVERDYAKYSTLGSYATAAQLRVSLGQVDTDYAKKASLTDLATKSQLATYATKESLTDLATKAELANYGTKADIARYVENKNTIMDSIGPSIDFIRDNYVDKPAFKRFKDEELPITVRKSLESNPGLDTNYIRYSDTVDLSNSTGIAGRYSFKKFVPINYSNPNASRN